jgi:hypothetical protein
MIRFMLHLMVPFIDTFIKKLLFYRIYGFIIAKIWVLAQYDNKQIS